MKIIIINYEFPPLGGGGGDVTASLCREFAAAGHQVKVLTSHFRGLPRRECIAGCEIIRVPALRRHVDHSDATQMACYLLGALPSLSRLCAGWKPDIIHCHFLLPTGMLALFAHACFGVPYVVTLHGGDVPSSGQTRNLFRLFKPCAGRVARSAIGLAAVSSDLAELAQADFPQHASKIMNIDNGVDLLDTAGTEKFDPTTFLVAGRLSVQKNIEYFLRAAAALKADHRIIILGDGPEREHLEKTARNLGIADRVSFKGWVERQTVIEHMLRSHFLVMPSLAEGMPIAGLQAYACGLPIIATRVAGLKNFVNEDQTGFLVELDRPEAFTRTLERACDCAEAYPQMSLNARNLARDKYSWTTQAERYISLFKQGTRHA